MTCGSLILPFTCTCKMVQKRRDDNFMSLYSHETVRLMWSCKSDG